MLSAAAFSVGWKHEAQKGSSAQAALARRDGAERIVLSGAARLRANQAAASTARHVRAARARRRRVRAGVDGRGAPAARRPLATALNNSAGNAASSVVAGASSVSSDLAKLTSELHTLTSYLETTPSRQLDSGYVAAQTAYITKTIDQISGEQSDLGERRLRVHEGRAVRGRPRRRAQRHELTTARRDEHAVADAQDAFRLRGDAVVVRDEQHRHPVLVAHAAEQVEDLRAGLGVERAGRLVREQQPRPVRERARDRDPLALAAGERRRIAVDPLAEPDLDEQLARPRARARRATARPSIGTCTFSSAVSVVIRLWNWKTKPTVSAR